VARKANTTNKPQNTRNLSVSSVEKAQTLIDEIEKSQIPFGESAPIFAKIKAQVDAGKVLSADDYDHLLGLVKKARDWEKDVESSSKTQPEETMGG